nr:MAG TPA: hypothetical protein [Caudoviricetes sp.]
MLASSIFKMFMFSSSYLSIRKESKKVVKKLLLL